MIANITRGDNPGNIGAYLHGPGTANEHTFQHQGKTYSGGVVIGGKPASQRRVNTQSMGQRNARRDAHPTRNKKPYLARIAAKYGQ